MDEVLKKLCKASNLKIENPIKEKESTEYHAYKLTVNGERVLFRQAKITKKKVGQFVTIWKRNAQGKTEAYNSTDAIDAIIIVLEEEERNGYFYFPKELIIKKGILTHNGKIGKMAIRVYAPWDNTTNKQAIKTQQWQAAYFTEIFIEKADKLPHEKHT